MRIIVAAGLLLGLAAGGTWGNARELAGIPALNTGVESAVESVSCGAPGDCAAGGYYADRAGLIHAFVADEVNGTWRAGRPVPRLAAFGKGSSEVTAVSCGGARDCVAVGWTTNHDAFAVTYSGGRWHNAVKIRAAVTGKLLVSCPTPGNCAVGGSYVDRALHTQAFVVREVGGAFGQAIEVPGTARLNQGAFASVNSVSCPSPRNCAVVGLYLDRGRVDRAFAADLVQGSWRSAIEAPGTKSSRGGADLTVVSCAARGNCTAGGALGSTFQGPAQAMVVSEVNGKWRSAIVVPGTAALSTRKIASVTTVSCAAPGDCSAGGTYVARPFSVRLFVANEVKGAWRKAIEVPGIGSLAGTGGGADIVSISCATPGNCSAGGRTDDRDGHVQAFVVSEVKGAWRTAIELPGVAALGTQAEILSVSCSRPGRCAAGGDFSKAVVGQQAMVADER